MMASFCSTQLQDHSTEHTIFPHVIRESRKNHENKFAQALEVLVETDSRGDSKLGCKMTCFEVNFNNAFFADVGESLAVGDDADGGGGGDEDEDEEVSERASLKEDEHKRRY